LPVTTAGGTVKGADGYFSTKPILVGTGGAKGVDADAQNGVTGVETQIIYFQKIGVGYQLLTATGGLGGGGGRTGSGTNGGGGSAGTANTGGPMTAAGFYNATGGAAGFNGGNTAAVNGTNFLMGGSGYNSAVNTVQGYYGYSAGVTGGYSQISPIITAISGVPSGVSAGRVTSSAFGCGGNGGISTENGGNGGDGLAIIVTW